MDTRFLGELRSRRVSAAVPGRDHKSREIVTRGLKIRPEGRDKINLVAY